jgi:Secretion system C-terminal sorting domain
MGTPNYLFLAKVSAALCIGMILHLSSRAQCANNLATRTYDTTLTSNGFGMYNLSFPQWSPDSGLLVSAKISATVSSQYGFTLRNADTSSAAYELSIGQEDQISGPTLSPSYSNITSQVINTFPLASGESVTTAPFSFLNGHISSDSITANVTPFLGTGRVNFNYLSFTYTNLFTNNNATYYYSANIANHMTFSVQYLYCNAGVALATDLTRFSAALTPPRTTQLSWAAVNETAGRVYEIQRSSDGKTFSTIASVPAVGTEETADYTFPDNIPDSGAGNWFYRLQIHDQANLSFSPVREVNITPAEKTLQIYPNPATSYINIITGQSAGDWQVEIFAANGNLVQRSTALQSGTLHIDFNTRLAAGAYFVRLMDLHGQKNYTTSFVVSRN